MREEMVKKVFVVLAALGALVGSGAAYSSLAAGGPSDDPFVVGGGRLGPGTFPGPGGISIPERDFSVDAHIEKKGTNPTGLVISGRNEFGGSHTDVTCVSIDGNQAVVGGVDSATGLQGRVVFLIDNGLPSSAMRDQSSATFVDQLDSSGWPLGFPYKCPAPNSAINTTGYLPVHSGDIVISDGND